MLKKIISLADSSATVWAAVPLESCCFVLLGVSFPFLAS
jgi:hypothetical protein